MPKQCSIEGCSQNCFTHGFCKKHSYLYYNAKPKKDKIKPQYMSDEIQLASIKKEKVEHIGNRCTFSGTHLRCSPDLVHIIRRLPSNKLNKRNTFLGSREFHSMFDDGKANELIVLFPWRMKAILKRMRALDEFYFNRFCGHNNINPDEIL